MPGERTQHATRSHTPCGRHRQSCGRASALSPGKPREAAGSGPGKIGRAGRVLKKELETTRRASSVRSCVASLACAHQRPTHEPNQRSPKKQRSRTHILGRTGWLCTSASSLHVIPPFLVIAAQPRSGPFRVELNNKVTQALRGQHARGKNAARHAVAHPMRASPAILRARVRSLPIPHCVPAWVGGAAQQRQWREKPQSDIKIIITPALILMLMQPRGKRRGTSEKVQLAEMRGYGLRSRLDRFPVRRMPNARNRPGQTQDERTTGGGGGRRATGAREQTGQRTCQRLAGVLQVGFSTAVQGLAHAGCLFDEEVALCVPLHGLEGRPSAPSSDRFEVQPGARVGRRSQMTDCEEGRGR